ncbi:RsmB/NOP family class I SAM-dependent RNA methyltransferase [Tropicimonas sp. S265A]|uniref:RsmB/NOP family class I SAM-dependent RNA methyltransferase n=1 Tax=Tropicimonas sp. S265A TaxID=3415134 RepID=UPI003C7C3DE3
MPRARGPVLQTPEKHAARAAALWLMTGVLEDGISLADLLSRGSGPMTTLVPEDRARAQRLATETLRHLRTCDQMLGPHLRLAPRLFVHNALRLATYEIMGTGAASHGVVNAAVDLVRAAQPDSKAPGLVNAVLRNIARRDPAEWQAATPASLPKPFRKPLVAAWGGKIVTAMEAVQVHVPPLDLTLKAQEDAATWAETLGARVLPGGSLRLPAGQQVSALPGYAEGAWWVQDAAAALPARLLAAQSSERVLDMCAAPGGKTLQLAATGAKVTALDISEARMRRVSENLARTRLAAKPIVEDALNYTPPMLFDAILLDAPCSASGTVRRHPDLPYLRDLSDLADITALQARLFDRAVGLLRPGGRLVFATCSLMPEEGEAQAATALTRHANLRAWDLEPKCAEMDLPAEWVTDGGALRLRPDHWAEIGGVDGFFIAGFTKAS